MEFFLGCLLTFLLFFILRAIFYIKRKQIESLFSIKYSQSHIHKLVKPLLPIVITNTTSLTKKQSINHINESHIKVIINKGMAYWIKNNLFYTARVVDGEIDKENAKVVDTMGMDKVELDKMLFIIDQLRKES